MKCKDAYKLMNAWCDGELPKDKAAAFKAHVAECSSCSAELDGVLESNQILDGLPRVFPPGDLQARTMARFEEQMDHQSLWTRLFPMGWGRCSMLVAGGVAGLCLGSMLGGVLAAATAFAQWDSAAAFYFSGGILLSWV